MSGVSNIAGEIFRVTRPAKFSDDSRGTQDLSGKDKGLQNATVTETHLMQAVLKIPPAAHGNIHPGNPDTPARIAFKALSGYGIHDHGTAHHCFTRPGAPGKKLYCPAGQVPINSGPGQQFSGNGTTLQVIIHLPG